MGAVGSGSWVPDTVEVHKTLTNPFPGSPLSLNINVSASEIMTRLRFIFFYFKIHSPSQFSLALQFQNSVL